MKLAGTVTGTFLSDASINPSSARSSVKSPFSWNENFTLPAFVTPFFSFGWRLNLLPPPLFAFPFLFRVNVWAAPPTSIVTGRPASEMPAPIVMVDPPRRFQLRAPRRATSCAGVFGYEDFRPGQEKIIATVLGGRDCIGVMPTGAGKSLTFQIPARILPGTVLVDLARSSR